MGPVIDQAGQDALMDKLKTLKEGDTLVLAGSIPESMPGTIYSNILEALQGRGIRFVVDATKDLLLNVLQYRPFLIKPNHHEIGEIFGVKLETRESVVPYAKKLQERALSMFWYPCPVWVRSSWTKTARSTHFPPPKESWSTLSAPAIPWSQAF